MDSWGRSVVEPVDPLQGGDLDVVDVAPGALGADQLGLVSADLGLGEGVVVGVADRADRGVDAGLDEPFGEGEEVYWLPASVWWTSPVRSVTPSRRRVQTACSRVSRTSSVVIWVAARQPTIRREYTSNDERDVDRAGPGGDVGEVGDPQPVRCGRGEVPVDQIRWPRRRSGRRSWCGLLASRGTGPALLASSAARPCTGPRRGPSAFRCSHILRAP